MAAKNIHIVEQTDKDVEKKKVEKRNILLSNKMKVMLINDPSTSKVSVALDIHIGNFSNPDDFPGLAHLCQRMTILGNHEYPEYQGFQKLIYNHGGNITLTTSSDHTTYYFDVPTDNDSVFTILHRFVQLFTSLPLFEDSWIEEEIRIMDSEIEAELQHDMAWFEYFERSTVKFSHPYSKYGLCKKDILTEMPIEQIKLKLIDFFQYYSANIMTLCIVSDFTSHFDQSIINIFDKLPNKEIKILTEYEDPFKDQLCTEWYIVPKIDAMNLLLIFPLPNDKEDYWCKAIKCISFFLKCNHKDSLLETLKAKNWCSDISTKGYQEARNLNFFHIVIKLLPEGYFYINKIITMIFEYFNLFMNKYFISKKDQLRLKKILQHLNNYKIFEEDQTFTQQRIMKIAKRIHEYSLNYILDNKYLNFDYILFMINIILDKYIVPQKIRVYVINDGYKHMTNKSFGWDDSYYTKRKIQEFIIDTWSKPPHSQLLIPYLGGQLIEKLFCEKIPDVIEETSFFKIWYMYASLNSSFIPQYFQISLYFISPHVYESSLNVMLYKIFFKLIKKTILNLKKYREDMFHYDIHKNYCGIYLTLTSYVPMKYDEYLSDIFSKIFYTKILPIEFQKIKDEDIRPDSPSQQAYNYLLSLLFEKYWPNDEILKENDCITIDEMYKFIQNYISNMYVKCLICCEMSKEQALEIIKNLKDDVQKVTNGVPMVTQSKLLLPRVIKLDHNTHVLFEVESELDNVSYTLIYYQVGKGTIDVTLNLALLSCIMHDRCSQYFKNIEHSKIYVDKRLMDATQGLIFGIKSIMDPYLIQRHIHRLIFDMKNYICQLSKEVFEKFKTDLITLGVLSLLDTFDEQWRLYFKYLYCSELKEIEKTNIEGITQTSLASFYEEHISNKKAALSVHVLPKNKDKLKTEDPSELEKFSNKQSVSSDEYNKPVLELPAKIYEPQFKKIENILQFKQTQNFYDEDTA